MRVATTRRRRKAIEDGNDAARRMRKRLRRAGMHPCAKCGLTFLASALDVDHIRPLALGGEDVDENVQALCRPCHKLKTRDDFGFTNTPF